MAPANWLTFRGGRLQAALRVQPAARRQGVAGPEVDAAGRVSLKVRVSAPPEDGKANAAVVRLLAKRWGVAPSRLSVVRGATGRSKTIEIEGGDQDLLDKIDKIEDTGG